MTPETAMRLAQAAAASFQRGDHRHRVVIGKDTRLSGYMLESALQAGFASAGMDVLLLGPLPTPAVGMLTRSLRADLGVMISASHNSFEDNGIKLFGPDGFKLSDAQERAIEALMDTPPALATSARIGRARRIEGGRERYVEFVKATLPRTLRLEDLRIVVDCAHGAAYRAAPMALSELGADVVAIGVEPDGFNINAASGSTCPEACAQAVAAHGADLGIALDGDADRAILVDERGRIVDGDQIMGLIATRWAESGRLTGGRLVATVMSNLGLERYLAARGVGMLRTRVGDRYVVEAMREHGCNVGGEQSGHVVLSDIATTGDGLLAALEVLVAMVQTGRTASETLSVFGPLPQMLTSVRVGSARSALENAAVRCAIAEAERRLGDAGRMLVRASGTEPVVRVMAEGEDRAVIEAIVESVCGALRATG